MQTPGDFPGVTAAPDGVMTLRRADGSRLSFAPATTEWGEAASGWDWTRYSEDDGIEAQDWAEDENAMFGVLKDFARRPDVSHAG